MSTSSQVDPELLDQTRAQIRGLVQEIEQLAKSPIPPAEFYEGFLTRVVAALAAAGGAIWMLGEEGALELAYQLNLRQTRLADSKDDQERHGRLLQKIMSGGTPQLVPPNSGSAEPTGAANPTSSLLILGPVRNEQGVQGVIELFQRPGGAPAVERGYLRFVTQMCELANDYLKSRQLRSLSDRQAMWTQLEQFTRAAHDNLDPRATAFTIANEGRRLIDCDRVTVAIMRGSRCRVEAISGQELFDTRSNAVQMLNRVATAVAQSEEPLWYSGDTSDLPPQIEELVEEYVDESHTKVLVVLPLRRPTPPDEHDTPSEPKEVIGTLIVEQIVDDRPATALKSRIDVVAQHSALALSNALDHHNIFLMPLWRTIGKTRLVMRGRTLKKTVLGAIVALVALIALFTIPYKFDLHCRGTLEPVIKQEVFAPVNGTVKNVLVGDQAVVKQGQLLVSMQNPDLEVKATQVQGDIYRDNEEIASLQESLSDRSIQRSEQSQINGKINALRRAVENAWKQLKVIDEQKRLLNVTSPISGTVLTWKVRDRLIHRPVQQGQVLMTVANPDGEWELELAMSEERMGYVQEAANKSKEPLTVAYIVSTDPSVTHYGKLKSINPIAEVRAEEGNIVKLRVEIDKNDIPDLRAGTGVSARVECGKASIGYVWLHPVINFARRTWFRL